MFENGHKWMELSMALVSEAEIWRQSVSAAIAAEPAVAGTLLSLAIFGGMLGRSVSLLLAAAVLAAFGTTLVASHASETRSVLIVAGVLAQVLLLLGTSTLRRQNKRLREKTADLQVEKDELKLLLDREILWRTAAGD